MRYVMMALLAMGMLIVVGCEETKTESATPTTASAASEPLPSGLLTTTEPAGAVDVVAAKKSAADGAKVVIKAKIGGQKDPLASGRAVMTVIDLTLPTCEKGPMDACATPWDACCEPTDKITANSATVQVVGADGKPLKANLGGLTGVAPGKEIVVAGVAKKPAGADALIIDATQIYVIP